MSLRRPRFSLRTTLIALTALSVFFALTTRHFRQSQQQQDRVQELIRLGGKNMGTRNKISVWYDDYAKWNDKLGKHEIVLPTNFTRNNSGVLEPDGVAGWIQKRFGRDCIYQPVMLTYDCWDTGSELKLTDEMIAMIKSLPIREIRLCKSSHMRLNKYNVLTPEDYLKVVNAFPDVVVEEVPDSINSKF